MGQGIREQTELTSNFFQSGFLKLGSLPSVPEFLSNSKRMGSLGRKVSARAKSTRVGHPPETSKGRAKMNGYLA
jgi:hypothetical protein